MFLPVKSDHGAVNPWEFMAAAAGTYHAGQLLTVADGKLTAVTELGERPPYLCMREGEVAEGDVDTGKALLPVTRISDDYIYETTLSAQAADLKAGQKVKIAAGGLETDGAEGGAFEVTTEQGDMVRGRFVEPAPAAE